MMADDYRSEVGAVATEYVLLVALIAIVVLGSILVFGETLAERWSHGASAVEALVGG